MQDELTSLAFAGATMVVAAPAHTVAAELRPDRLALPEAEIERIARFRLARDRQERQAAHGLLRHLVGPWLRRAPGEIVLDRDAFGRPYLPDSPDLDVNVSHGSGWVAVGLARGGRIGVDVEGATRPVDWDAIAPHFMHATELATYLGLPAGERASQALEIWTVKEACLKASGQGLSDPPEEIRLVPAEPGWHLTHRGVALRAASLMASEAVRLAWATELPERPRILVAGATGSVREVAA